MRDSRAWPTPQYRPASAIAVRGGRRRPTAPRPGRSDRIATGRLIPKRGPATPIELEYRNSSAREAQR